MTPIFKSGALCGFDASAERGRIKLAAAALAPITPAEWTKSRRERVGSMRSEGVMFTCSRALGLRTPRGSR
jgi:hypothetical protein